MADFSTPRSRNCRHVIEVFNTQYTPDQATHSYAHYSYRSDKFGGWCLISDNVLTLGPGRWKYSIDEKTSGEFTIWEEDLWLFGLEIVRKHVSGVMMGTYDALDRQLVRPSRILICLDDRELSGDIAHYPTIVINGRVNGVNVSETIQMNGFGSMATKNTFESINYTATYGGKNEIISMWADMGTGGGYREFRWNVDSNRTYRYGLMAAGYIIPGKAVYTQFGRQYKMRLAGYQDRLETIEFIAGYRAWYRCAHYRKSGTSGECVKAQAQDAEALRCWRQPNLCWVGDLDTMHPDSTHVPAQYRCSSYSPKYSEPLPYTTYTYFEDYCDRGDPDYEPYPESVFQCIWAAVYMANTTESTSIVSKEWTVQPLDYSEPTWARILTECNIRGDVWRYLESVQDFAQQVLQSAEVYVWVDMYKRIRVTELDLASPGRGTSLNVQQAAMLDEPEWELSGVTNIVSSWVYPLNEHPFYASMSAKEVSGYEDSMTLFMSNTEEFDNQNLRNYTDFKTYATNYLKTHAYPCVTQRVKVDSFIPSEHYWVHNYPPLLNYTDNYLRYIDLLSTKVNCLDFSMKVPQSKTFVITAIEQEWGHRNDGNIDTTITMKRRMRPSEFN